MKTIADFKRAIQVGTKLHCVHHQSFAGRDDNGLYLFKDEDKGTREVSVRQSSQFALRTKQSNGVFSDYYNNFPKKYSFHDRDKFILNRWMLRETVRTNLKT